MNFWQLPLGNWRKFRGDPLGRPFCSCQCACNRQVFVGADLHVRPALRAHTWVRPYKTMSSYIRHKILKKLICALINVFLQIFLPGLRVFGALEIEGEMRLVQAVIAGKARGCGAAGEMHQGA